MRIVTTLAATAVAATLTLGGAGAAQAETQVRNDAVGDTVVPPQTRMSPSSSADILSLKGTHADGRLTFTLTLADLTADDAVNAGARFVSPDGREYQMIGFRAGTGKQSILYRVSSGNAVTPVECDGLQARFVNRTDRIVLSTPRSCVGNPRTVRFGGAVYADTDFSGSPRGIVGTSARVDDARRNGSAQRDIKLGTRQLANN